MSILSEKFETLLQWSIYKNNDDFKKYVIQHSLNREKQQDLITAYAEVNKYHKISKMKLADVSLLDCALKIKEDCEKPNEPNEHFVQIEEKKSNQKENMISKIMKAFVKEPNQCESNWLAQ